MRESSVRPGGSGGQPAEGPILRFIRFICVCVGWIILYAITLEIVAGRVRDHLLGPSSHDGYAAYVALMGFLMVMPIALLLSLVILGVWKRWWLFFVLAPIAAVGAAIAPAVLG